MGLGRRGRGCPAPALPAPRACGGGARGPQPCHRRRRGPGRWWARSSGGTGPGPQKASPRKALGVETGPAVTVVFGEPVEAPGTRRGAGLRAAGLTLGPSTLIGLDEGSWGSRF